MEIKKITKEMMMEDVFDVNEEACYNDCHNYKTVWDPATGRYVRKDFPTCKNTSLF